MQLARLETAVERQKRISEAATVTNEEICSGIAEIARDTTCLPRVRLAAWSRLAEIKGMTGRGADKNAGKSLPSRLVIDDGLEDIPPPTDESVILIRGSTKVEPPKTEPKPES